MTARNLKELLGTGETVIGLLSDSAEPLVIEMCGYARFDFVCLDLEHGVMPDVDVANAVRVAGAIGLPVLVRVGQNELGRATRFVESGGDGVIVSHVSDASQVAMAVDALLAPPAGHRSIGPTRNARLGFDPTDRDWATRENNRLLLGMQIEDRRGVIHARQIAGHPAVSLVLIGARDLSFDLGVPGRYDAPALVASIRKICDASRNHAAIGLVVRDMTKSLPEGAQLFLVGLATVFRLAADHLQELRAVKS